MISRKGATERKKGQLIKNNVNVLKWEKSSIFLTHTFYGILLDCKCCIFILERKTYKRAVQIKVIVHYEL